MSTLTLRFASDSLEREFHAEYARSAVRPARATTVLIIALFLGYGVLDLWTGTHGIHWPLRAGVVAILSAILALTWHPVFERAHSWILSVGALVSVAGMLAMLALAPETGVAFYPGIGVAVIGTFALFRIRFPIALAATLVMLAAYEAVILTGSYPSESPFVATLFLVTCVLLGAFAGWNIERYARQGFLARKGLEEEQARSERLLLNVLPESIAERLKTDPAPIADRFPEASILFADIVGFTELSKGMEPEALVRLLNELFTGFDRIAERHGLEKIKTIGDAYMAVSGVPVSCPDHLERVADAALEMREVAARRTGSATTAVRRMEGAGDGRARSGSPGGGRADSDGSGDDRADSGGPSLAIRIGIDTGPVVAGVIGEKKFIYDLWGDPVTMASRMESHGVAGEIQVTEAVWERLRDRYALAPRGDVEIKGRGETRTYWLIGALDGSAVVGATERPEPTSGP